MENILLILNIVFAIILVLLVLMQKSEGGALGIGVSQENFMFSRTAGNFMTKATAIIATLFIICSLGLTIISRGDLAPSSSVLDTVEEKNEDTPQIPEEQAEPQILSLEFVLQTIRMDHLTALLIDMEEIHMQMQVTFHRIIPLLLLF